MIVITNPIPIAYETNTIHSLFAEGLKLLHIRKPDFSEEKMKAFLREIGLEYKNRLVLHQHHSLAEAFGINRIHFTEKMRNETSKEKLKFWKEKSFHLSTSIHKMEDFNFLENVFEYAFLSPVFPSISKENYLPKYDFPVEIKKRSNFTTRLVALGGISSENIHQALTLGFDDVALLGTIWNSDKPIENFKQCQQIALSH